MILILQREFIPIMPAWLFSGPAAVCSASGELIKCRLERSRDRGTRIPLASVIANVSLAGLRRLREGETIGGVSSSPELLASLPP